MQLDVPYNQCARKIQGSCLPLCLPLFKRCISLKLILTFLSQFPSRFTIHSATRQEPSLWEHRGRMYRNNQVGTAVEVTEKDLEATDLKVMGEVKPQLDHIYDI